MNKILDIFAAMRDVFYAHGHKRKINKIDSAVTGGLSACVDRYVYALNKIFKSNGSIYRATINKKLQVSINRVGGMPAMIINFEDIESGNVRDVEFLERLLNEHT